MFDIFYRNKCLYVVSYLLKIIIDTIKIKIKIVVNYGWYFLIFGNFYLLIEFKYKDFEDFNC